MRHANTNGQQHIAVDDITYEEIFGQYTKALWAEAYRLLQDVQEAKDVVQELIIEIWEKRSLANVQTNVRSYLFQSLRYKCYRYIKTKDAESQKKADWSFFQDISSKAETRMESEERKKQIYSAIRTLPLQSSNIFTQVFIEGRKRKDVAEELGISINTVNVHIYTACKKLQQQLKKLYQD
jgi:RNA polymerase sigma-70 factor (family 1)